jgi:hypothetical protein
MEESFNCSTLASHLPAEDEISSDEEQCGRRPRRTAPLVNAPAAKQVTSLQRIFIDSRDRDRTRFPSANDFRQTLTVPLRAVRSITLTNAQIPITGSSPYVAVVLRNLRDRTLTLPREHPGLPPGVLAIVPLVPVFAGAAFVTYSAQTGQHSGGAAWGWRISIPQGLPQLRDLHIQLFVWASVAGTPTTSQTSPYGLAAEAVLAVAPAVANNVYLGLEIEHDI